MARTLDVIDLELRNAVTRRTGCRERIDALTVAIAADTRRINELLAERAAATDTTEAASGR